MRLTSLVAFLPALALAQEQVPLADRVQGWFNKAKSYVPAAAPADPVVKVAEKLSETRVTDVTLNNWESVLAPGPEDRDLLVFITGGNNTCFNRCEHATNAFKESTLLFSADATSPELALLDCESERVLCAAWACGAPSAYYFQIPKVQPEGEERPLTPLHVVYMNSTTVTPEELYQIHSKKTFQQSPAYEGIMHPIDGVFAKYKVAIPIGYAIWATGAIPSWAFMIFISMFSRTFMGRRMTNVQGSGNARTAPAGSAN
ncbi:hypothetical protein N7495_003941 [Penicillium taxi]|uniref:uncharacterized protein n=1 Tax=Penicillium taxi TaxID=168475 RepID=UPI002545A9A3|nr:uncharacterized protein N7495_003941 [Penicillium taxi]KAJ5899197.1 hypothetical protein N7495_003941 [Penicillium taxi]